MAAEDANARFRHFEVERDEFHDAAICRILEGFFPNRYPERHGRNNFKRFSPGICAHSHF